MVIVESSVFVKAKAPGDFLWMVKRPEYADALFIIGENFLDSMRTKATAGGGTARLRPYTYQLMSAADRLAGKPPRAAGVPTGFSINTEGFPYLDDHYIKRAIDLSLERIVLILDTYPGIKRVIFSSDPNNSSLIGTNIFKSTLSPIVIEYISKAIHNLPQRSPSTYTFLQIREMECKLVPFALKEDRYARVLDQLRDKEKEIEKLKKENASLKGGAKVVGQNTATGKKRATPEGSMSIIQMLKRR